MSARTSDAAIAAAAEAMSRGMKRGRTGNAVHRLSFYAGEKELRRWMAANRFARSQNNARLRAAEEYETATRKARRNAKNGALGHIALEVYRLMLRLRGRDTGRLDPSIKWLAEQLGRSIGAIHRAITRLRDHGFLDWVRRTQKVDDPVPGGPQVEQISNAYFLELRDTAQAKAASLVRLILRERTEAQRQAAEAVDRDRRATALQAMTDEQRAAHIAGVVADPEAAALYASLLKPKGDSATGNV